MFFRDLNRKRSFPVDAVEIAAKFKLIPIISLELWDWSKDRENDALEKITKGLYDEYFSTWASKAAKSGRKIIFRFGFEMNGNWFHLGQKPVLFKNAWNRVHRIFNLHDAMSVQWMFSPNVLLGNDRKVINIDQYYPGDEVVDLIGIDGYNFGDGHDKWHQWERYTDIFEDTIKRLSQYKKPLYLSEIGCAADPRKFVWLKTFLRSVSSDRRIKGFIYFNFNKISEGEPDWRLDSDKRSLEVFRSWVN